MFATVLAALALGAVLLVRDATAQVPAPQRTRPPAPWCGSLRSPEAELAPEGPGYHWESNRGHAASRYGLPELVQAVRRAAAAVLAKHPGSHVGVLDLSLRGGGHLRGHLSHTRGRDVDVEYYALDEQGAPARLPRPLPFDHTGVAVDPETGARYLLDRERTWDFVAAVLTDPTVVVHRVFINPTLRALLLEHARARGAPDALVRRAAAVMRAAGPRSDDPHQDHFHIRVRCAGDPLRT